jgi:hypothetical protein
LALECLELTEHATDFALLRFGQPTGLVEEREHAEVAQ